MNKRSREQQWLVTRGQHVCGEVHNGCLPMFSAFLPTQVNKNVWGVPCIQAHTLYTIVVERHLPRAWNISETCGEAVGQSMFHNTPSRHDIIMALFIFKRSTNRHLGVFLASIQPTPLTFSFLSIYLLTVVVLSSRFVESAVITMFTLLWCSTRPLASQCRNKRMMSPECKQKIIMSTMIKGRHREKAQGDLCCYRPTPGRKHLYYA